MGHASADEARIGTQIAARYRLDRIIGKGGMGTVYEGVHLWTGRPVAVKLLIADESAGNQSQRILAEARAAAAVRHPHLVEVLDVGVVEPGLMFLVLELLEGESLHAYLDRKDKLRVEDALDIVVPILDALEALHRAKILHRDVKPGNVFLSKDGRGRIVPKLLDLGISKRMDAADKLTRTGALMGTPSYMSPEQARGMRDIGPGVDVWAVGVLLFECLTGRTPFLHETIPGMLHLIATGRPPPVASLTPDLPGAIGSAVDHALAYEPEDRFTSASDFADALVNAALAAGWPLTCRIPAGPMLSLAPDSPSGRPATATAPPIIEGEPTPLASSPPFVSTPVSGETDTLALVRSPPAGVEQKPSAAVEAPPDASPPPDDSPVALPLRSSRGPLIAVGLVAALAVAGAVAWVQISSSDSGGTAPPVPALAHDEPPPEDAPAEPASEPTSPTSPVAAIADAGVAVPIVEETAAAPAPERPARARVVRPRPPPDPAEPVQAPPRIREGANRAPLILD